MHKIEADIFMVPQQQEFLSIVRPFRALSKFARSIGSRSVLAGLLVLAIRSETAAQLQPRLAHRWEVEPDLGASWVYVATRPIVDLEPSRFSTPERQFRLAESQKVIRNSSEPTMTGRETSLQSILSKLKTIDENELVQRSLVTAAIKLADDRYASELWERLRNDPASRMLIEPALIRWKSPVALDVWRTRLSQTDVSNSELIVAIEGIVAAGGEQDIVALETLLRSDRTSPPMKIMVARAMGSLSISNLEGLAEQVNASRIDQHSLIVAELLSRHSSERSRQALNEVLKSDNAAARSAAYHAISQNYGTWARELAPEMISQSENQLRQQAVEVLNRFADADSLRTQSIALGDRNLAIRSEVRENLITKAQIAELKPIVDEAITFHLKSDSPHAIVQAILLSVALNERDRCPSLVTLLEHNDMDTSMTAAWALQALVDSHEMLDLIFQKTERITQRLLKREGVSRSEIYRQAYLFEALGRNGYRPALDSLKLYIPKNEQRMGDVTRASAIWAIGKINAGSQDAALAKQLAGRMLDQSADDPESPLVQFASAVALGWIKAPASVRELQRVADALPAPIALARDWSLSQLKE
jgi:hypothetical protein